MFIFADGGRNTNLVIFYGSHICMTLSFCCMVTTNVDTKVGIYHTILKTKENTENSNINLKIISSFLRIQVVEDDWSGYIMTILDYDYVCKIQKLLNMFFSPSDSIIRGVLKSFLTTAKILRRTSAASSGCWVSIVKTAKYMTKLLKLSESDIFCMLMNTL